MRLYIWDDVLTDYSSGIMFALAHSVDEARDLLRADCCNAKDLAAEPKVYDLTETTSRVIWGGS